MAGIQDKKKQSILRLNDLTSLGVANFVTNAISGLFWLYVASLMGSANYGEVSYLIAIASLASVIASLGMSQSMAIYTAKKIETQAATYVTAITSSVITSLILFFLFNSLGVSLYVIGYVIFGLAIFEVLGHKLYKSYSKYIILQRTILVGLALSLYYVMGPHGVILGSALSFFPFIIPAYKIFKQSKINFSVLKPRMGLVINSYVLELSKTFSLTADKLVIFPMFGFALLGNYQLGVQILTALIMLPYVVYLYTLPRDATGSYSRKLKILTILVSVILAMAVIVLTPFLLPIILPEYTEAIQVIQIMGLAAIPLSINYMYFSRLLAEEKNKILIIGSAIFVFVQLLAIYILGNLYGVNGAAIAMVLAATAETMYLVVISKHF